MMLLGCFSICFASSDLKTLERTNTVDYKVADDFYNNIDKTIVEDKVCYELKNIDRVDNFKTLTKEKEIIEERVTNTNNLDKVISLFNETKDIGEDGYIGTLTRDNSTLKVEIKDSYQEEYKVYLQKSYDNVHDGLKGVTYYCYKNHIKLEIHGHLHEETEETLKNGTRVLGKYKVDVLNL